jgi:protein gp37
MSDIFHIGAPDEFIFEVFDIMNRADQHVYYLLTKRSGRLAQLGQHLPWRPHIWAGVTVEANLAAVRADHLRATPAMNKFISAEPLLGMLTDLNLGGIDWLFAGPETGPNARPCNPKWIEYIKNRCEVEGVGFGRSKERNGMTEGGRRALPKVIQLTLPFDECEAPA